MTYDTKTFAFNRGKGEIRLTYQQADRLWYVWREDEGAMRQSSRRVHNIKGNATADFEQRVREIKKRAKNGGRM